MLPLDWHVDATVQHAMASLIEDEGPRYLGHLLMVPKIGDYRVLETTNDAKILIHGADGQPLILSNICRHQQAYLINPKRTPHLRAGNIGDLPGEKFICPAHHWVFDQEGRHCGSPCWKQGPKIDLPKTSFRQWNGLLYSGKELSTGLHKLGHSGLFDPALFDFSQYSFVHCDAPVHYPFSWDIFVEVYLDLYHVAVVHPQTLAQYVDVQQSGWEMGSNYSVQVVGWKQQVAKMSAEIAPLREVTLRYWGPSGPPHGALWMFIYPNIMVEWYPMGFTVSTVFPTGTGTCVNYLERYVANKWRAESETFQAIHEEAYNIVAQEDADLAEDLQQGRQAAHRMGDKTRGPIHPELEKGISSFHEMLIADIGKRLPSRR